MSATKTVKAPDDFKKWAETLENFVKLTGGKIVCYDEDMKMVALDATEFVLKLIAAHRILRGLE